MKVMHIKHLATLSILPSLAIPCIAKNTRPNIVLINIDDLGWTDLSFQGSSYYETPNIDRLRNQSLFFPNGYAAAANSAPSRASMLTGVYSPRHKVYTVAPSARGKAETRKLIPIETASVPDSQYQLLTETLQENGYTTCHVGKWHLGADPTQQGCDVNIGGNLSGHPKSYSSPYKNDNLPDGPKGEFLTDRLASEAINFMENAQKTDDPFFLYFATYAVHTPHQPKSNIKAKYEAKPKTTAHFKAAYAALIETMDVNVGVVIDYLEEKKLTENTIIIFTSDNGGFYTSSRQWPLRAGKGSFYEGGIRVPIMVRWDGHTTSNTIDHTPICQIDFYPTLLSITGIDKGDLLLDGVDISTLINNTSNGELAERPIFWHFPAYLEGGNSETTDPTFRARPLSVIRKGDWKLIYNYETEIKELYNIKNDISEKQNLAESNAEKCEAMYNELTQWLKEIDAPTEFKLNPKYNPNYKAQQKSNKKNKYEQAQ